MSMNTWSETEIITLKGMWVDGKTTQEISDALPGKSRNAVIGKIDRMKMKEEFPHLARKQGEYPRKPKETAIPPTPVEKEIAPGNIVSLMNFERTMCRWAYGDPKDPDFGFCGQHVPEIDGRQPLFCEHHHKAATSKARAAPEKYYAR